jgi:outer membrane protein W
MRKLIVVAALLVAGAVPRSAAAASSLLEGFQLGVRTGWAVPFGAVEKGGGNLADAVEGQVPIWLDLGYRITPALHAAAVVQYGLGRVTHCPSGQSCLAQDGRFGLTLDYHFLPSLRFDPYAGVGMAFDVLSLDLGSRTTTYRGFEWLNVQVGADWPMSKTLRLGPVMSYGLGQFLWRNGSSIDSTDVHHWVTFAVRATFDL